MPSALRQRQAKRWKLVDLEQCLLDTSSPLMTLDTSIMVHWKGLNPQNIFLTQNWVLPWMFLRGAFGPPLPTPLPRIAFHLEALWWKGGTDYAVAIRCLRVMLGGMTVDTPSLEIPPAQALWIPSILARFTLEEMHTALTFPYTDADYLIWNCSRPTAIRAIPCLHQAVIAALTPFNSLNEPLPWVLMEEGLEVIEELDRTSHFLSDTLKDIRCRPSTHRGTPLDLTEVLMLYQIIAHPTLLHASLAQQLFMSIIVHEPLPIIPQLPWGNAFIATTPNPKSPQGPASQALSLFLQALEAQLYLSPHPKKMLWRGKPGDLNISTCMRDWNMPPWTRWWAVKSKRKTLPSEMKVSCV